MSFLIGLEVGAEVAVESAGEASVVAEETAVVGEETAAVTEEVAPLKREFPEEDEGRQQLQLQQSSQQQVGIQVIGEEHLRRTCAGISGRLENHTAGMGAQIRRLEGTESELFSEGQYVRTGALRDSLTRSGAAGAVRRVHGSELEFGSSIPYAKFQVEDPGPETPAGGLQRKGHPSAVLKLDEATALEVTRDLGEYLMRGNQGLFT